MDPLVPCVCRNCRCHFSLALLLVVADFPVITVAVAAKADAAGTEEKKKTTRN